MTCQIISKKYQADINHIKVCFDFGNLKQMHFCKSNEHIPNKRRVKSQSYVNKVLAVTLKLTDNESQKAIKHMHLLNFNLPVERLHYFIMGFPGLSI